MLVRCLHVLHVGIGCGDDLVSNLLTNLSCRFYALSLHGKQVLVVEMGLTKRIAHNINNFSHLSCSPTPTIWP